jgi:two-component system OmpR family response regulator
MASVPARLLIVDDDREICSLIAQYFERHAFEVATAHSRDEMIAYLGRAQVDLILLDVMLPGANGFEICKELRLKTDVPIIMLTAVSDLADRVAGLEIGADDYVAKPFEPRELLARVRAVIRRRGSQRPPEMKAAGETYVIDGWTLDVERRRFVSPSDVLVTLTYAEFELLASFARYANRPLSRNRILELISGIGADQYDRSVDVLVSRLRRRLQDSGCNLTISSIRNIGYALQATVERQ